MNTAQISSFNYHQGISMALIKKMLVLLMFAYSINSNATLIDQGNTTLQTSAHLEWLDVSTTAGLSIDAILGGAGGYISNGWGFANFSQVYALFSEAGAAPSMTGLMVTDPATITAAQTLNHLLGVLSPSITFGSDPLVFIGTSAFAMSNDGTFSAQFVYQVAQDNSQARLWDTSNSFQYTSNQWGGSNPSVGNYLVRSVAVPEPSTLFLLFAGMFGVFYFRAMARSKR
ncbi:MAG: PEP-CTERM sorting domain-containing protein [Burkholderiaceae bacterium]